MNLVPLGMNCRDCCELIIHFLFSEPDAMLREDTMTLLLDTVAESLTIFESHTQGDFSQSKHLLANYF